MNDQISLREIRRSDCLEIARKFEEQGWNKPESQFLSYLQLQLQQPGERDVIIAETDGEFAGYLTMTWGGLRGGISIALALSLPAEMGRELILSLTYTIVVFSILVQGLTIKKWCRGILIW